MDGKTIHILLVEDREAHAELIRRAFESRTGQVSLTVAPNLRQARARLAESTPDLMITDWKLPDGEGIELLPANKNEALFPVIVLTGHGNERWAVDAIKAGALDYVVKSEVTLAAMPQIAERILREWGYIVERRQAEEALRESEVRIRTIVDNAVDGIITIDEKGIVESFNPAAERIFGYKTSEVIGKSINMLMLEPDRSQHDEYIQKYLRTRKVNIIGYGREVTGRRKDGTTFPLDLAVNEMHLGEQQWFVGIVRDITERKETAKQLEEYANNLEQKVEERTEALGKFYKELQRARDRTDGIIQSIGDGLVVTDVENQVILMNWAAEDILRIRFNDVLNQPINFVISEESLRLQIKNTLDKKAADHPLDFNVSQSAEGKARIIRARSSVIQDKAGEEIGVVTIMYDVTQEREVDRMKTEFISTAAHELRTPLTSIQGFAELLLIKKDLAPEKKTRFLSHINREAVHLANIVGDLLDISRIESSQGFSLEMAPCEISQTIQEVVSNFQEQFDKHQFKVTLPSASANWVVDKEKMKQVFQNLFSNAVKYSPSGGSIQVVVESEDGCFRVSVEDQGMGMTPGQVGRIFEKFYRADASNTAIEGTGLGMTIVKYIIEAHGGKIWVESQYGKGTAVRFTVPI